MKIRCPFICAPSMRDAMPEAVIASARIVPGVTPKPFVVHLEIRHRAAGLTPPAIATQDLPPQALRTASGPAASAAGFCPVGLMMPFRSDLRGMPASALGAET
jgi:hypothetical protein